LAEGLQTAASAAATKTAAPGDPPSAKYGAAEVGPADAAAQAQGAELPDGAAGACPSCGATLVGDYCHACGEKRPEARDLSMRHFVRDTAQELTSLDSKLFRTLFALLFRPGLLTVEWIRGRRAHYLKPLNLCLGIFAVNLFVYTASKQATMFDIGMILQNEKQTLEQWHIQGEGGFTRLFRRAAERRNVPPESLQERFNERWQRDVSLLQPAIIVVLAVLLQLVYVFSRRYFVEHLVFSMHFLSFATLTTTLIWPVYYFFIGIQPSARNFLVAMSKFAVDIVYLFFALRAFYRGRTALAALRALIVFVGYFIIYITTYMVALAAAAVAVLVI
jgi:hypothetical protein